MSNLPALTGVDSIDKFVSKHRNHVWTEAANRMFDEWRKESPSVCILCWLRFMDECEVAIEKLQSSRPKSYVMRIPFLSNGLPVKHYKRRVTLADFGLSE